ncbi:cytochrome c oxidase assembly protein [Virgibacillus halophilus]|uniref:Cytochrome c oxidase assembly protein n=1 Tax=Tigheibacillus halophilus TaxID=361280 RepID=A0ABU5C998_9BACI|nr:cytochrome c oxidase assembly protein [Virgibacillus halophilus]
MLPTEKGHVFWKKVSFVIGTIGMFLAIGSPLNIIARIAFRAHIMQIVVLFLIVAPLLVYGAKLQLLYKMGEQALIGSVFRFVSSPVFVIILFYLLLYAYHVPIIFDFARMDMFLNYFYLLALFIAAILLWIPLIHGRLSVKEKQRYAGLQALLMLPLGIWLLFSDSSLFTTYTDLSYFSQSLELCLPAGETLPSEYIVQLLPFSPIYEQHMGGGIWLGSELLVFSLVGISFFCEEELNYIIVFSSGQRPGLFLRDKVTREGRI